MKDTQDFLGALGAASAMLEKCGVEAAVNFDTNTVMVRSASFDQAELIICDSVRVFGMKCKASNSGMFSCLSIF